MQKKIFLLCFIVASLICFFVNVNAATVDKDQKRTEWIKHIKRYTEDWTEIANKLETCEAYQKNAANPMTQQLFNVQIKNINDECLFTQELPGMTQLECHYAEDQRKAIAHFYKESLARQVKDDGSISLEYDTDDLLNKYIADGICFVSQVGSEEIRVTPLLIPFSNTPAHQGPFSLNDIKMEATARREGTAVNPIKVVINFNGRSLAQAYRYSPIEDLTARYNHLLLKVLYMSIMEELIDHTEKKNGFTIEFDLHSSEKIDKITSLKGKLSIDLIDNDKVVVVSNLTSLLKQQRVLLDSPKINMIGRVSIEKEYVSPKESNNNKEEFTLAIRNSSVPVVEARLIDAKGNTIEPYITMGTSNFTFSIPENSASNYSLQIIPLNSYEIPFDFEDILIRQL